MHYQRPARLRGQCSDSGRTAPRGGKPYAPPGMTALCDRVLRATGPCLFEATVTTCRCWATCSARPPAWRAAMGVPTSPGVRLARAGWLLIHSRRARASRTWAWTQTLWNMAPVRPARIQHDDVDWPACPSSTAGPATWHRSSPGAGHHPGAQTSRAKNLGIYRQQVLNRNQVIMRWLAHRGGALDFRDHCAMHPASPTRGRGAGADPPPYWAPSRPCPTALSEYQFAGLLRGGRTEVIKALGSELARARQRPRSCSKATSSPTPPRQRLAARAEGTVRRPHRLLQRAGRVPRAHRDRITLRAMPSTTAPTPANRPTSPPCWAWH